MVSLIECTVSTMDLWFLIDGSGSVGPENFWKCLQFVNQTAAQFVIHPDRVRTGLMVYSDETYLRSLLNEHQSNEEFSDVVLSTRWVDGLYCKLFLQLNYDIVCFFYVSEEGHSAVNCVGMALDQNLRFRNSYKTLRNTLSGQGRNLLFKGAQPSQN